MRTRTWGIAAVLAGSFVLAVALSASAQEQARPTTGEEKVIAGFEGETLPREWEGTGAKISLSEEHATEGKKSLKVELTAGPYPGAGMDFRAQDWSSYDAIRFSVFNQNAGSQWCTVRVDDATSRGVGTRFNLEDHAVAVKIEKGLNEIEVPISAMRQGTPESQGIDVTRVKRFKFFIGGMKRDAVLFLDNVRLVREERKGPDVLVIADFDKTPGKVTAGPATAASEADDASGKPGKSMKIDITPEADYASIYIASPADWLSYDLLCFDLFCPEAASTPSNLDIKITDTLGRSQTFSTGLGKGLNEVCLPMEAISFVSPSRIKDFSLFWGKPKGNMTVYLDNVRLERVKLFDAPTRHAVAAETDRLTMDYSAILGGKNTCYMLTTWIPLKAGGYRAIRCNSPTKTQPTYGIDADGFKDADEKKPVRLWTMFLDHGVWSICETFIPLKATGQTKFSLDDAGRFGL